MGWPLDKDELRHLERQVDELAWDLTRRMLALPEGTVPADVPPRARRTVALAKVAACEHLRKHIVAQAAEAAGAAADAGADYVEIADAVDLSKQGARQRWPNLAARTKAARAGTATPGQRPLSGQVTAPVVDAHTAPDGHQDVPDDRGLETAGDAGDTDN